jgi:hypothetical protein
MKKNRKMQLHRETLRSLQSGDLPKVAGATAQNTNCSICVTYCKTACRTCTC